MSNEIPLYQNMINDLIHKIEGGKLQQDAKLPSEADLGDSYTVSRITVRRA
ncbi:GntR family transcriptional regulator, partial [Lacticaseibacillus rhamnosus]|nr:GntR family transcriptional regulator [Lacticaseibacillus rhamnosus]